MTGEVRTPTFCALCRSRCGSISVVEDGVFRGQEPDPAHPTGKSLCVKGRAAGEIVNNPQRLSRPLRRTRPKGDVDPGWQEITWDEALGEIAAQMQRLSAEHGPETVAFSVTSPSGSPISDGIKWIERLVNVFGSPNLARGTEICNWHKDFSHAYTFGRGIESPDFRNAGCIILWGHNPSATWLDHATAIAEAKARGAALIVVDPRSVGFASRADQWLRVRPGSDGALALSIANEMLRHGLYDRSFVTRWTNGPLLVREDTGAFLRRGDIEETQDRELAQQLVVIASETGRPAYYTSATREFLPTDIQPELEWSGELPTRAGTVRCSTAFLLFKDLCARHDAAVTESVTSVPAEQVRAVAELIHRSGPTAYYTWSGISQHANATQTDRAIAILYALTGSIDDRGGNVEFAKHPTRDISGADYLSKSQLAKCVSANALPLGPAKKGWIGTDALYDAILDEEPYAIRALVGFGANLILSHASPDRGRHALSKLEFFVQADVVMTPTAELADIVLPANTPWEREALRVGFEVSQEANELIQWRPAVVSSLGESRSDGWIVFELAKRLGLDGAFWNGDVDAAYDYHLAPTGITLDDLRRSPEGIRLPLKTKYRKYEKAGFATPTGKIEIYSETFLNAGYHPLPSFTDSFSDISASVNASGIYPLILTSAKVPQYCHSQHRHVPSLRRRMPDPEVSLHPDAAEARDIENGEWVDVATANGAVRLRARFDAKIDPRVVVAQYGWWQANDELGLPALGVWDSAGANFNRLIDETFRDRISGSTSHRAYPCEVRAIASEISSRTSGWRPFRVRKRVVEADGISSLYLYPVDGANLGQFSAGQFISVRVKRSDGKKIVRNYSISSSPQQESYFRISVKKVGEVSSMFNADGIEGEIIEVRGAFGRFTAAANAERPLVLLAGGIGITPFISILNHFSSTSSGRVVTLFYGIRTEQDYAFADELLKARAVNPNIRIVTFLSEQEHLPASDDQTMIRGMINVDEISRRVDLSACEFMLCGPPMMVQILFAQLANAGVERSQIRTEAFGPASLALQSAEPQRIVLERSAKEFMWQPDQGSLLEQIERLGVSATSGCRAGQCESCKLRILSGQCEHPDGFENLDAAECLPCIARPRSLVVLDL